jgi:hypothetical protein
MRFVRRPTKGGFSVDRRNFELLESRFLLSAVAWTGAGDDVSWGDPANWSNQAVPTISDDVSITDNSAAPITISSGAQAVASLTSDRAISITGGSLNVASTANLSAGLNVNGGGLVGGTWSGGQPVVLQGEDVLNGVTLNSDVTLQPSAVVTVEGGLTLNGTMTLAVSGNAYAEVTSEAANLQFDGTQSLMGTGNILLNLSANPELEGSTDIVLPGEKLPKPIEQQPIEDPAWSSSINVVDDGSGDGATLTIGTSITIHGGGLIGPASAADAAVINDGTISPDALYGIVAFIPVTNDGTIAVPDVSSFNFGTLPIIPYDATNMFNNPDPAEFTSPAPVMLVNNGTITDGGSIVMDNAGWSNTGEIEVNQGALELGSGINSGSIDSTGGDVDVTLDSSLQTDFSPGSINLTGASLSLTVNGQTSDDSINRVNLIHNDAVYITGTIDNTGQSIVFAGYENELRPIDGEIDGGTLSITNGAIFAFTDESTTFRNLVMEISDSGEMLIGSPYVVGVVPTFGYYGLNSATLNIAYATDSTLGQLSYDSPTGQVSIANQVQELNSYQPTPPTGSASSMQASVTEQIAVVSAPQPSPMASAAPVAVAVAAPTAKAAPPIHASQAISGTTAPAFSQSLIGVVSQIESGGSAVDNLLFAEEPIFA